MSLFHRCGLSLLLLSAAAAFGDSPWNPADRTAIVNEHGVLRWEDTREEVALFGVNYYAPFALTYLDLKRLGYSVEETIDHDVLHLARLGLDALRLHVWDTEISDPDGNLVENEHLRLLDYLIARAAGRGIYTLLTPIAWFDSGTGGQGFSIRYTKEQMSTDPSAIQAQRRYLSQFVSHVNSYTGRAYKDDPAIIAFELIAEPVHPASMDDGQVTAYINTLAEAIRATECRKPIFYNSPDRLAALRDSTADGLSVSWYPTGLVNGRSLRANYLARVRDRYPSLQVPELAHKAKIVYEFDAADVPGSYLYPAMARALRRAGTQIAAQFQYDPLPLSLSNFFYTWETHFLNLVCAPGRTLSFLVAAEAFRRLPRLPQDDGYPANGRFGPFRVSYEEDLSELATENELFYSNDTTTEPPSREALERIAGYGSSEVVRYEGAGAYFLEKLLNGAWRLEVYPDAVWVNDPFGTARLNREVCRVLWREWPMEIRLPDLGPVFTVEALDEGNTFRSQAREGKFAIRPGVYVLRREGSDGNAWESARLKVSVGLREFATLPEKAGVRTAWHMPFDAWAERRPLPLAIAVVGAKEPDEVLLHFRRSYEDEFQTRPLGRRRAHHYSLTLPAEWLIPGGAEYAITVRESGEVWNFPLNLPGQPPADPEPATRQVVYKPRAGDALPSPRCVVEGNCAVSAQIVAGGHAGAAALRFRASGLADPPNSALVELPVTERIRPAGDRAAVLVLRARGLFPQTAFLEIGLYSRDGAADGYLALLPINFDEVRIPLGVEYRRWGWKDQTVRLEDLTAVTFSMGSWMYRYGEDRVSEHGVDIEWLALEPAPGAWRVPVASRQSPVSLFDAQRHRIRITSDVGRRESYVPAMSPGRLALQIAVNGFGPQPSAARFYNDIAEEIDFRCRDLAQARTLRLRARALEAATTAVEIALLEQDASPWGTNVGLTTEWREIEVPLSDLRHFAGWGFGPPDRGRPGDRFRPENVAAMQLSFGAWLYPGHAVEPHTVEIESIELCPAAVPRDRRPGVPRRDR